MGVWITSSACLAGLSESPIRTDALRIEAWAGLYALLLTDLDCDDDILSNNFDSLQIPDAKGVTDTLEQFMLPRRIG